jgi:hypothetical protein
MLADSEYTVVLRVPPEKSSKNLIRKQAPECAVNLLSIFLSKFQEKITLEIQHHRRNSHPDVRMIYASEDFLVFTQNLQLNLTFAENLVSSETSRKI